MLGAAGEQGDAAAHEHVEQREPKQAAEQPHHVTATAALLLTATAATQQAAEQGKQPDADALAWVQETLNKEFVPLRKERKAQEVGPIPVPPKKKQPSGAGKSGRSALTTTPPPTTGRTPS